MLSYPQTDIEPEKLDDGQTRYKITGVAAPFEPREWIGEVSDRTIAAAVARFWREQRAPQRRRTR